MKRTMYLDSMYKAVLVQKKQYVKGAGNSDYVEFIVTDSTKNYEPFEELRNTRGKRADRLIFKLQSKDYTNEAMRRKVKWKLAIKSHHISKIFPLVDNKAQADLISPNDSLLLVSEKNWSFEGLQSIKIYVGKGKRNDKGFIQMFLNGDLDEEMKLLDSITEKEGGMFE